MENLKLIGATLFGFLAAITAVLGIIGGAISARYWLITLVILSILNIAGLIVIPWFAGITVLSAIGTPLFMLFIGLAAVGINMLVLVILSTLLESRI